MCFVQCCTDGSGNGDRHKCRRAAITTDVKDIFDNADYGKLVDFVGTSSKSSININIAITATTTEG